MPRTASTGSSGTAQHHRRQPLPASHQPTPVLFRLPEIDIVGCALDNIQQDNQGAEDLQASAAQTSNEASSPAAVTHTSTDAVATPPPAPITAESPATESSTTEIKPSVSRPAETQPAETQTTPSPEPERSWWEHWSSGVVLILLIIALVTASIIAFSESASSDPDVLADADDPAEFSLDGLSVSVDQAYSVSGEQALSGDGTAAQPSELTLSPAADTPVYGDSLDTSDDPESSLIPALEFASTDTAPLETGSGSEASSVDVATTESVPALPSDTNVGDDTQLPSLGIELPSELISASGVQPVKTAQLLTPQATDQPSLTPPPASRVTSSDSQTGGAATESQLQLGGSPSFYDGAAAQPSADATALQTGAAGDQIVDTQQPSYESLLTAGKTSPTPATENTPPLPALPGSSLAAGAAAPADTQPASPVPATTATYNPSTSAGFSTAAHTQAPAESSQPPAVIESSKPDLDIDALLRAYQEFRQLHQQSTKPNSDAGNRYLQGHGSTSPVPGAGGSYNPVAPQAR